MADTDSFIEEVSEEVRKDQFYAFLRKWGWLIGLVLLLIVGGAGANEWRKHRAEQAAQSAGDSLRAAMLVDDPGARAEALEGLVSTGDADRVVAALAEAGALLDAGDRDGAAARLTELVNDPAVTEPYRSLANLQRIMILGAELPASERLATLETLTYQDAPFRPLALEQRALVYIEQGDMAKAVDDLEAILSSPLASQGLMGRARQLLVATGNALPVGGAEPGADG